MNRDTIFIYPTDTVWGIGGSVFSKTSFDMIADVKKTSRKKPVSILFSSMDMFRDFIDFPFDWDDKKVEDFFSLESTLLIPRENFKKDVPAWNTADSEYVGVRLLVYSFLQEITKKLGGPVTTTSLNLSGEAPIIEQGQALSFFQERLTGKNATFIDTEEVVPSGESSTILKLDGAHITIVRAGNKQVLMERMLGL